VAIIGDSTFIHAGIPPLIDAVYNKSHLTLVILDNSATGMTGSQPHPSTGKDALGQPAPKLDLEAMCRAAGVEKLEVVDTWQRKESSALRRSINRIVRGDRWPLPAASRDQGGRSSF
jgi:indolepyruvate ferredoxin oxidoreductase alpha subunit